MVFFGAAVGCGGVWCTSERLREAQQGCHGEVLAHVVDCRFCTGREAGPRTVTQERKVKQVDISFLDDF